MKKSMYIFGILALLLAGAACNNSDDGDGQSDEPNWAELAQLTDDTYYVAGYDANSAVPLDDGTAKSKVYLFISENLQDTVGVYNLTEDRLAGPLFDDIYEFPAEIMPSGGVCGFVLFPEKYRYAYPVRINSHRPRTEDDFFSVGCVWDQMLSWIRTNKSIVVESLTKIE